MIVNLEIYVTPADSCHTYTLKLFYHSHTDTYIFDFLHRECVVNIRCSFHVSRFCDDRLGLKFVCHDFIQTEFFFNLLIYLLLCHGAAGCWSTLLVRIEEERTHSSFLGGFLTHKSLMVKFK